MTRSGNSKRPPHSVYVAPPRPPNSEFLDQFGIEDAAIISRWVKDVGPTKFAELVLAFTQAGDEGRPAADYSKFLSMFDAIKNSDPSLGEYAIANRIAKTAFEANDWGEFRPPATEKSFAETIAIKVKRRANQKQPSRPPKEDGARAYVIASRTRKRVAALASLAERFISVSDGIGRLKAAVEQACTPDGVAQLLAYVQTIKPKQGGYDFPTALLLSLLADAKRAVADGSADP